MVWFILGVSISFWLIIIVGGASLALALTPAVWSGRSWSGFVVPIVLVVTLWTGVGLGWRLGKAVLVRLLSRYIDITHPV